MSEQLKFFKGLESSLPAAEDIQIGALYHCIDTNNTYLGVYEPFTEVPFVKYNTTSYDSRIESLGFSLAAATGLLTAGTVYKVYQTNYYALSSKEYTLVNLITDKENFNNLRENTYYYCTDEQKVYKTTDLLPGYELYSSASGKRQLGGGTSYDDGDAKGIASFAGGNTDQNLASAMIGYDITDTGWLEDLGIIEFSPAEKRLKDQIGNAPKATGEVSLTYGSANNSVTALTSTIGFGSTAGARGFYIQKLELLNQNNKDIVKVILTDTQLTSLSGNSSSTSIEFSVDSRSWGTEAQGQLAKLEVMRSSSKLDNDASIILRKPYVAIGEIISINSADGIVEIDNTDKRITSADLQDFIDNSGSIHIPYNYTLYAPCAADIGIADIHFGGLATGLGSSAAGTLSQAHGKMNTAAGQFSFAVGQNNITGYGAFASGEGNRALGINSHVEGADNDTRGINSHAEGSHTYAYGTATHAEGHSVINFNPSEISELTAENVYTNWAKKDTENKVDRYSVAYGNFSHVEGQNSLALGNRSHAEGWMNAAIGEASHAEGRETIARGKQSHTEGGYTTANGYQSHAEGGNSTANGSQAHAEGYDTDATGSYSHSEGYVTSAEGTGTHSEGGNTSAIGEYSHTEGHNTVAYGKEAHAEGESSTKCSSDLLISNNEAAIYADWNDSNKPAGQKYSVAYGNWSHVEGQNSLALGPRSHAEGWMNTAASAGAHAEGRETKAGYVAGETIDLYTDNTSPYYYGGNNLSTGVMYKCLPGTLHISGDVTWDDIVGDGIIYLIAYNQNKQSLSTIEINVSYDESKTEDMQACYRHYGFVSANVSLPVETAHIEFNGEGINLSGIMALTLTTTTLTSANASSHGLKTEALGCNSFAEGKGTVAASHNQHVEGRYNKKDLENKYAHIVGNGTGDNKRSNAYTLDWDGNGEYAGNLNVKQTITSSSDVKVGSTSLKTTANTANEAKSKAEKNTSRLDALDISMKGVYPLGTYYNGSNTTSGYLINLGTKNNNAYIVLKVTGFSGGNGGIGYMPVDSTYQFYCYPAYENNKGIITKCAATVLGHNLGDLTVYRYENQFYAHLPVSQTYLTLNFEIISDKTNLTPTVTLSSAHTTQELMVVIAPKYKLRNGTGTNSELFNNAAIAAGENSHAEGNNTAALGSNSHAEGNGGNVITVQVSGDAKATKYTLKTANTDTKVGQVVKCGNIYTTIAARTDTQITTSATLSSSKLTDQEITIYPLSASGNNSHAEGYQTIASGAGSHAEGGHGTTASGSQSHAEGYKTSAKSQGSHAEGKETTASGEASHAEGKETTASGQGSHAEGYLSQANGNYSHAEGCGTITHAPAQHVQGKYNKGDSNKAFIIGGGSSDSDRKNIMTVDWNGNISSNNYRGQNTYNLGSYYGLGAIPQGYLFDLGPSGGSLMVVFKITGHSYIQNSQPFNTTFQFYAWDPKHQSNGTPFHTTYSGVTLGEDVGDFTAFYVNEGTAEAPAYRLYMYLNETGMYQTYNFELITNTAISNRITVERTNVLPEGIPTEDSPYRIKIIPTRATAAALTTNAGSETQPVYFENGVPKECSYTLDNITNYIEQCVGQKTQVQLIVWEDAD